MQEAKYNPKTKKATYNHYVGKQIKDYIMIEKSIEDNQHLSAKKGTDGAKRILTKNK